MNNTNYITTIEVAQSANEVFNAIKDVTKWWTKDYEGNSSELNDVFIVDHPGQHYSKQQLVEVVPDKRIVWLVTESYLNWVESNKEEWTDTRMLFEISTKDNKTVLHFTHEGLRPEKECYAMCEKGWSMIIKDWLYHFITTGTPSEEMDRAATIRNQYLDEKAGKQDFHKTITVNALPKEAMNKISEINRWWIKDFSGNATQLNNTFKVLFGAPAFVDFIVSELIPDKKMVWKVTDCYLPWFEDKKEWNNTEVVFELTTESGQTKIDFTHIGLVPGVECYDICEKGWIGHINTLEQFINEGKGLVG